MVWVRVQKPKKTLLITSNCSCLGKNPFILVGIRNYAEFRWKIQILETNPWVFKTFWFYIALSLTKIGEKNPDLYRLSSWPTSLKHPIKWHFFTLPFCDTNIGTCDRSFLLEKRCLSHLLWLNGKIFLIGTNCIQKFENLACRHNFFRFLIAL